MSVWNPRGSLCFLRLLRLQRIKGSFTHRRRQVCLRKHGTTRSYSVPHLPFKTGLASLLLCRLRRGSGAGQNLMHSRDLKKTTQHRRNQTLPEEKDDTRLLGEHGTWRPAKPKLLWDPLSDSKPACRLWPCSFWLEARWYQPRRCSATKALWMFLVMCSVLATCFLGSLRVAYGLCGTLSTSSSW